MPRINKQDHGKYVLSLYHKKRKEMIEYLGGKCVICGSIEKLEFDHVENLPDKISIAKLWSYSWERLIPELDKCQLLCESCHDEKSIVERGHTPGGKHGTVYFYRRNNCRCDLCVEAYRSYYREYKKRNRAKERKSE